MQTFPSSLFRIVFGHNHPLIQLRIVHEFEILYLGKLKPEFILFFLNHVIKWQLHVLYSIELAGKEHKFSVGKYFKDSGMWLF